MVHHLSATVLLALSSALFSASCLKSPTAPGDTDPSEAQSPNSPEPIGEAHQESGGAYQSKDFRFVEFLKDDGEGEGGGWQTADKTFDFAERDWGFPMYFWQCPIRIGMPIRCAKEGRITPSRAALYSADVANAVVDPLLESRTTWKNQGAAFCVELQDALRAMFKQRYPSVGATVSRP